MERDSTDSYRASLWPMPPQIQRADGEARRLGVELEFAGLDLNVIAQIVRDTVGGEIVSVSDYEVTVRGGRLGDVGVELDYSYLKNRGRERREQDDEPDLAENFLALVAQQVVPHEIVGAPVAMGDLWQFETVLRELRKAGAKGTGHAAMYAFGLHLNPEMPDLEVETITRLLRAFLLLQDWLGTRRGVDLSRKLTPYIDLFPDDYRRLVCQTQYRPDPGSLIDDYLVHNPTRNRALDMLPLFAHVDEDRVRAVVSDDRVKSRPALHYRLPDCRVDEPEWGLVRPWRDWLQVEALAFDSDRLARVTAEFADTPDASPAKRAAAAAAWVLPELL